MAGAVLPETVGLEDSECLYRVDERGQILLGEEFAGRYFRKEIDQEQRMILVSYDAVPEREVWLHQNPAAMSSLGEGIRQIENGEGIRGYSFLT